MKKGLLLVGSLALATLVGVSTSSASNIVFVSFHPGDNNPSASAGSAGFSEAPDAGYTQLLTANGHTVTRVITSGNPDVTLLNSADLVIISRSVGSGGYQNDAQTAAWNGITAPTMILGGYVLRGSRLGFTTGETIPDTVGLISLNAVDPSHPIFQGIALDSGNTMLNPYAGIITATVNAESKVQRGISVNTDSLAGGGTVLARVGTAGDPTLGGMVIGEWQAGAILNTGDILGGHRLIFLTGSREHLGAPTSEIAGIYDLTPDGAAMFLNAVDYMTGGPTSVPDGGSTLALLSAVLAGLAVYRKRVA